MRVLIVYSGRYLGGAAAAKRVQKLSRGLRAAGAEAFVVSQIVEQQDRTGAYWDEDDYGVPYTLVFRRPSVGRIDAMRSFLAFRRALLYGTMMALRKERIDAVIFYGDSWYLFRAIATLCRQRQILCLIDFVEWYPMQVTLNPFFWDRQLLYRGSFPWLSGAICISRLWTRHTRARGVPAIRIPAIGEASPGPAPSPMKEKGTPFTLTYLGELVARDLPDTLLEGVRLVVSAGANVRLVVVGAVRSNGPGGRAVRNVKGDALLKDRVTFTGWVSDEELRRRLAEADALVLLRSDARETRACFPSRLPEYLLTAHPVILSEVGDMSLYFRHRRNAWLLPPGSRPGELAEALTHLACHVAEAREIGQAGRQTAIEEFSYLKHGRRLLEFMNQVCGKAHGAS